MRNTLRILNLTDTPSFEEAEMEDTAVDLSITQTEDTKVFCKWKEGAEEIHPEYLRKGTRGCVPTAEGSRSSA